MSFCRLLFTSKEIQISGIIKRMCQTARSSNKYIKYNIRNGVAVLKLNDPTGKVNTLSKPLQTEMMEYFNKSLKNPKVTSMVLISAKPKCFIAGSDMEMLANCVTKEDFEAISISAQNDLNIIENSPKPVVAAIMGSCTGGGLEVALACQYRIAVQNRTTVFSFPEVLLGILPAAGGTQRIFKYCNDYLEGVQMMLTGRNVRANQAKKLGLVDFLIDTIGPGLRPHEENTLAYLESVAIETAQQLSTGELKRKKPKTSIKQKFVTTLLGYESGRRLIFNKIKSGIMKLTNGLYPAPMKIVDLCETAAAKGSDFGYELETKYFGQLCMTKESNALIGLFYGRNKCTKNRFDAPYLPASHIVVLGAGFMGAGISQVSIEKDFDTTLKDVSAEALSKGTEQIHTNLLNDVKKSKYTSYEADQIMSKLHSVVDYNDLKNTDIVIEAVCEDLSLKHNIVKEVESKFPSNVVFASNTSALPIHKIAGASIRPKKVIGMHYFSPVDKMPLLEIVTTDKTDKETKAMAVDIGLRQGKMVIVVGDGPGFYTSRILAPMLSESVRLMQEGVSPTKLDKATRSFGWPVGLVTFADEVGLDVVAHVAKDLSVALGSRFKGGNIAVLNEMVAAGFLGRKTERGCYTYGIGTKWENCDAIAIFNKYQLKAPVKNTTERIQYRLFSRFVNEAVMCLQDKILFDPIEGDIGAVFGLGFPPFLGGPFRYLDNHGASKLGKYMEEYAGQYGEEFKPCDLLLQHIKNPSLKFHSTK